MKSEIPSQSAFGIPQSAIDLALAHAERSYPIAHRPTCPIRAKLWDYYKQHCIEERTRIERERFEQQLQFHSIPSEQSNSSQPNEPAGDPPNSSSASNPLPASPQFLPSHPDSSVGCDVAVPTQPFKSVVDPSPTRRPSEDEPSATRVQSEDNPSPSKNPSDVPAPEPAADKQTNATNAPSEPNVPASASPREVIFEYMMRTNPAFRRRHQLLDTIRARLKNAEAANAENAGQPSETSALDDETAEIKFAIDRRSPLDLLPPGRQRILYDTILQFGCPAVAEVITQPVAEGGWDVKTTDGSLQRFRDRYERRTHAQRQRENDQLAREILANPNASEAELDAASRRLFKTRLLETLNSPSNTSKTIRDYFHSYTRLCALDLAAQRAQPK